MFTHYKGCMLDSAYLLFSGVKFHYIKIVSTCSTLLVNSFLDYTVVCLLTKCIIVIHCYVGNGYLKHGNYVML